MQQRMCSLLAALVVLMGVVGCGEDDSGPGAGGDAAAGEAALPGEGKPAVRFGTKNFTEQFILGELYAQALQARGWSVELKPDIGSTEVTDKALNSGVIDVYPEYTGTTLSVVKGQTEVPRTAEETYELAKAFYERRGQTMLAPTPFEDRDALAVTAEFAERHGGLDSTGDLRRLADPVTLGAAPEFRTRFAGLVGLRREYGLRRVRFRPLLIDQIYGALDSGRIQVGDVFTTDAQLASGRYVVLEDPKGVFGFQNLAPVVSQTVLEEQGRAFAETLDAVSAELTTDAMQQLNAAVALEGREPAAVAERFLRDKGLLGGPA